MVYRLDHCKISPTHTGQQNLANQPKGEVKKESNKADFIQI